MRRNRYRRKHPRFETEAVNTYTGTSKFIESRNCLCYIRRATMTHQSPTSSTVMFRPTQYPPKLSRTYHTVIQIPVNNPPNFVTVVIHVHFSNIPRFLIEQNLFVVNNRAISRRIEQVQLSSFLTFYALDLVTQSVYDIIT